MCPSDPGFLDYLARTCRKLSAAKPDFFMVDSLLGVLRKVRENFDTAIPGMIYVCATHHHLEYARDYA